MLISNFSFAASLVVRGSSNPLATLCKGEMVICDLESAFTLPISTYSIKVNGGNTNGGSTLSTPQKYKRTVTLHVVTIDGVDKIQVTFFPAGVASPDPNWGSNIDFSHTLGGNPTEIKILITHNGSGPQTDEASLAFSWGWQPSFQIVKNLTPLSYSSDWLTKLSYGCTQDYVYIRAPSLKCPNDELKLSVQELEYNQQTRSFSGVGSEFYVFGGLNLAEKGFLTSPNGLNLSYIVNDANRSQNGSTITFQPGKYYSINLIYADQGKWYPSYKYIQINGENWDLVLKDNETDNGAEPIDVWTRNVFKSPDLWNRLNDASTPSSYTQHQDPDYVDVSGNTNRMFYRVTNIGCAASPADMPLRLFWTRARTNELWDQHWLYDMNNNSINNAGNFYPLGSEITIPNPVNNGTYGTGTPASIREIPSIAAGQTYVPTWADGVDWFPPNNAWYDYTTMSTALAWTEAAQRNIICLLGKINESANDLPISPPAVDPIVWQPVVGDWKMPTIPVSEFVANNNNVNTRNSTLTANSDFLVDHGNGDWDYGYGTVMVNNPTTSSRNVNLCINLIDNGYTTTFADYGDIYVGITNELWASWVTNGATAVTNATVAEPGLFLATSGSRVCINDVDVAPGSVEQIGVRFLYDGNSQLPSVAERYYYELEEIDLSENPQPTSKTVYITDVPTASPVNMQTKRTLPVQELLSSLALEVYPNPARNLAVIGIQSDKDQYYTLEIVDINGRVVFSEYALANSNYTSMPINIENYRSGLYMARLRVENRVVIKKFVVNN